MKHGKIWLTAAVLAALHIWGAVPGYAANSAQDGQAVTGAQTANATQIGNTAQTASVVQNANAAQAQQDYWDGFKHVPNYAMQNAPRPVGGVSPTPQESAAAGNAVAPTENAAKQVTVTQEADGSTTVTIPPATQEPSALERARQSRAERIRHYSDSELWSSAYYAGLAAQRRYYYDYYWPRLWLDWDWHWGHHHHHHAPPPPRGGRPPRGPRPGGPRR